MVGKKPVWDFYRPQKTTNSTPANPTTKPAEAVSLSGSATETVEAVAPPTRKENASNDSRAMEAVAPPAPTAQILDSKATEAVASPTPAAQDLDSKASKIFESTSPTARNVDSKAPEAVAPATAPTGKASTAQNVHARALGKIGLS